MSSPERRFAGFTPEAIDFLADLAQNNDRAWFTPRKATFERLLKAPMEALVAELAERFAANDIPLLADPKRSIFRIHRDTRFAKDKSPYKTHLAAGFRWIDDRTGPDGADQGAHAGGGYVQLEPGNPYVGGGLWMPERPRLDAFRRAVVDEPERVAAALDDPGFRAEFGSLMAHEHYKRVPPGWPADHPRADLLRYKDLAFGRRLADDEVYSPDLPDIITRAYLAAMPVFRFLATLR
jgi:uncharacterized protein (TIGR02453 family)